MTADRQQGPIQPEDLRRFHAALASRSTRQGRSERWLRAGIRIGCRILGWHVSIVRTAAWPTWSGPPGAGCVVAVAPHRAWIEPFLLVAAWPPDAARLVWLADGRTVSRSWWRRRLLPYLGVIPISGDAAGPRRYGELTAEACARGFAVAVFPEVGPASAPGTARRISPGFAYLALQAGAPVIPVVIGGTHHIVRGSWFSVDLEPVIDPGPPMADALTSGGHERAHRLRERLERVVGARLPERDRRADALAPERDRWTWLGRLLR